jgi:hypothetical protein
VKDAFGYIIDLFSSEESRYGERRPLVGRLRFKSSFRYESAASKKDH